MTCHRPAVRAAAIAALFGLAALPAAAQTAMPPTSPATPGTTPQPIPEQAPGVTGPGTGQGVLRPPHDVDPAMVTPPQPQGTQTMPIIKPPANAR